MNISDLTIRVTIKQYTQTQDAGGGSTDVEFASWTVWANKKNPSGNQVSTQAQQTWNYQTKFTVRYNKSFKSDFKLFDATGQWVIDSLVVDKAGYKEFMILSCSKVDDDLS